MFVPWELTRLQGSVDRGEAELELVGKVLWCQADTMLLGRFDEVNGAST